MPTPQAINQALHRVASAKSNATGEATFSFGPAPSTVLWTGSVTCPTAPLSARFTAYLTTELGSGTGTRQTWVGPSVAGYFEATYGQVLSVTATGLTKTKQYKIKWVGQQIKNSGLQGAAIVPGPAFVQSTTKVTVVVATITTIKVIDVLKAIQTPVPIKSVTTATATITINAGTASSLHTGGTTLILFSATAVVVRVTGKDLTPGVGIGWFIRCTRKAPRTTEVIFTMPVFYSGKDTTKTFAEWTCGVTGGALIDTTEVLFELHAVEEGTIVSGRVQVNVIYKWL